MSSLDDRRRGRRQPMPGPEAFSLVLALGIAGVVLGAVLSLWAAPEKNSPKPV